MCAASGESIELVVEVASHRLAPGDGPTEMQVIRFGSRGDRDRYMADDRRLALAAQRDAAVRRTEVMEATVLV